MWDCVNVFLLSGLLKSSLSTRPGLTLLISLEHFYMSHQTISGILEATMGSVYNFYLDVMQFYMSQQTIVCILEATVGCVCPSGDRGLHLDPRHGRC